MTVVFRLFILLWMVASIADVSNVLPGGYSNSDIDIEMFGINFGRDTTHVASMDPIYGSADVSKLIFCDGAVGYTSSKCLKFISECSGRGKCTASRSRDIYEPKIVDANPNLQQRYVRNFQCECSSGSGTKQKKS